MRKKRKVKKVTKVKVIDAIFQSPHGCEHEADEYCAAMDKIQNKLVGKKYLMRVWVLK